METFKTTITKEQLKDITPDMEKIPEGALDDKGNIVISTEFDPDATYSALSAEKIKDYTLKMWKIVEQKAIRDDILARLGIVKKSKTVSEIESKVKMDLLSKLMAKGMSREDAERYLE